MCTVNRWLMAYFPFQLISKIHSFWPFKVCSAVLLCCTVSNG